MTASRAGLALLLVIAARPVFACLNPDGSPCTTAATVGESESAPGPSGESSSQDDASKADRKKTGNAGGGSWFSPVVSAADRTGQTAAAAATGKSETSGAGFLGSPASQLDNSSLESKAGEMGLTHELRAGLPVQELKPGSAATIPSGRGVAGSPGAVAGAFAMGSVQPAPNPQELRLAADAEQKAGASAYSPVFGRQLAARYLQAGSPKDAERVATKILEADPAHPSPQALTLRAQARAQAGDAEGAYADAKKALALDPSDVVARAMVGHRDELKQAAARMKKIDVKALGSLQFEKAAGGDGGPAEAPGRSLLSSLAPEAAPAQGPPSGSPPGAAAPDALARQAAALSNVSPLQLQAFERYKDAYEKASVNDFTGALLPAMQAVDLAQDKAKPLTLKAFIENRIPGEPPAALQDAGQALALEPGDAAALREKAYAELQVGQVSQASADIERALQLEPGSGLGFYYRGLIAQKEGRLSDAAADFSRAVALDPGIRALVAPSAAPPGAPDDGSARKRLLFRGGAIAASLLLIVLGLAGTAAGRRAVTTVKGLWTRAPAELPTVAASPAPAEPGALLAGTYRLVRELGRGGMGVVYEAVDEALQRGVAVKRLQRESGLGAEDMERLLREARLVAKLRHPRIAEIYNVVADGDLYLVFELVDGKPLDGVLAERVRLSPQEARRALADIASAVGYAHAQKIIHRDLKPSNVMVEAGGGCKVMDFGIAHQSSAATVLTRTSASGTPPYMSPEQAMGSVSKASDLYALSVMAYELLSGRRPFAGPDFLEQKLNCAFTPPSGLGLPSKLDGFFAKGLEPDPTKRFASAQDLLAGLDAALG